MNFWNDLRVQPFIGNHRCVLTWRSPEGTEAATFTVARSFSGADGTWEVINVDDPVTNGADYYADDSVVLPASIDSIYYRVIAKYEGKSYKSPIIDLFSRIPRMEYGIVASIINEEFISARVNGGHMAWHCIPKAHGELADNIDPTTGQKTGAACGQSPEDDAYGMKFKGGFSTPILTWVRLSAVGPLSMSERDDRLGIDANFPVRLRLLAFPRPRMGHMIVLRNGHRYVIGERSEPFMFRGLVPLAWHAEAQLLDQADDRQRFPVPSYPHECQDFRL